MVVKLALYVTIGLAAAIRLWLDLNLPLSFLAWANHDDGLFMRQASYILAGQWLGPYDQLTHAKGAGYGLYLALASIPGLPITFMQSTFQIAALAIVSWVIFRLSGSRWLAALFFVVAVLFPVDFVADYRRVMREQIYWPLILSGISLFALAQIGKCKRETLIAAFVSGVLLCWACITREERVEIIPSLLLLFVAGATIGGWKTATKQAAVVAAIFCILIGAVSFQNYRHYGVFLTVDIGGPFGSAMKALQGVGIDRQPHLAISNEARLAVAKISPTFAPIAEDMKPGAQIAQVWGPLGCTVYPEICGDIATGWFMWALRDSAEKHGYYKDASSAASSYLQVSSDIRNACSTLRCVSGEISIIPPMSNDQLRQIPGVIFSIAKLSTFTYLPTENPYANSEDADSSLHARFWAMLNRPHTVSHPSVFHTPAENIAWLLKRAYNVLWPWVAPIGAVAFMGACVAALKSRRLDVVLVVAAACWAYIGARIVLLAVIHVTMFPTNNYLYLSSAMYMIAMAVPLSFAALYRTVLR